MDRYNTVMFPDAFWFEKAENGEWVKYADVADLESQLVRHKKALELAHAQLLYETAKHHFATPADVESWLVRAKEVLSDGPIRD